MILKAAVLLDRTVPLGMPQCRQQDTGYGDDSPPEQCDAELPDTAGGIAADTVIDWLSVQSDPVREAVAQLLATDIDRLRHDARIKGFASGEAEGLLLASTHRDSDAALLHEIVGKISDQLSQTSAALQERCPEIVAAAFLKIAGPLLGMEAAAAGAVREVLRQVKAEHKICVRVNGADLAYLLSVRDTLAPLTGDVALNFVADEHVSAGGCIVDSEFGSLDATFDQQVRGVIETLRVAKRGDGELA